MVRAITTGSGMRKTPTEKEITNSKSNKTNSDNDTTSDNIHNNSKDTTIKEMQSADPFCKRIVKRLLNKTAPEHELKSFFIHNGLLYQYAKCAKLAILSDFRPLQWGKIGKVVKCAKLAVPSDFEPLWWEKIGKVAKWA